MPTDTQNQEFTISVEPTNADAQEVDARPDPAAPLTEDEISSLLRAWRVEATPQEAADAAGLGDRDLSVITETLEANSTDSPVFCEACEETYNPRLTGFYLVRAGRNRHEQHCEHCYTNGDYIRAADTGDLFTEEYGRDCLYYHDGADEWYESEPEDSEEGGLHGYGLRVDRHFGWPAETPPDSLCFGVELETEPKRGASQRALVEALGGRDGDGRYILKEDGSLDNGAELVTLPYTLDYHRERFGWDKILDSNVARVGRSGSGTNSCGMHVHVNRRALSPLTIGKMIVFLNNGDNAALVTAIAQRASNGYCTRDAGKKITDIHSGSRYDLLNVSGSNTVEFRLFKGNLRPERVLKNLEFCHALVRFSEQTGIKASARGSKFLTWLANREKEYPHLHAFLIEKGMLPRGLRPADLISEPVAALDDL